MPSACGIRVRHREVFLLELSRNAAALLKNSPTRRNPEISRTYGAENINFSLVEPDTSRLQKRRLHNIFHHHCTLAVQVQQARIIYLAVAQCGFPLRRTLCRSSNACSACRVGKVESKLAANLFILGAHAGILLRLAQKFRTQFGPGRSGVRFSRSHINLCISQRSSRLVIFVSSDMTASWIAANSRTGRC
jgi:hypothetical protein